MVVWTPEPPRNMIPNHDAFLVAIRDRQKVCVRYYSNADGGLVDRICAPVDYGPDDPPTDGLNRYWLWEFREDATGGLIGLAPAQMVDVRILGEPFEASVVAGIARNWTMARDWAVAPAPPP